MSDRDDLEYAIMLCHEQEARLSEMMALVEAIGATGQRIEKSLGDLGNELLDLRRRIAEMEHG